MATAQIVSYDFGRHNADLDKSALRVMQGATWKKQRVVVLIPSAQTIAAKVALSHWNLIFPPNQPVHRMLCLGMEVGDAYSSAIEAILSNPELSQWEYVLTMESDNIPPPDGLLRLIANMEKYPQYAVIGGLYFCKGPDGAAAPHLWGDINDPIPNYRPQPPRVGEIIECYGTSMGFHLWRLSMFKDERLRRPWFKTVAGLEGVGTQDLHFSADARKYGYRFAVDCGITVGHYDLEGKFGPPDMVW